ncbi:MAG: FAD-binding oxidoreductase [Synechococcus sp. SB0669_bin_7]|nr:FAD-binding oxidoreductase [Synechococcus sp. SB0675_bin_7]MYK85850.1 FAD-binding oxidoreductase [Synechococcus sp. SB0669_bin_7]
MVLGSLALGRERGTATTSRGWLRPTLQEVPDLLRQFNVARQPWRPAGLGGHLHWCRPVPWDGQVVSVAANNRILRHSVEDFTVEVEAGLPLSWLQAALAEQGQWLAVDPPPAAGPGTIGGLVARGLSAGLRHRYLGIRDQLIGVGFVRADGVTAKAGGRVVKNVAGYDLMRLLCGSWGSLALLTRLTMRTYPMPSQRRHLLLCGAQETMLQLRQWLLRSCLTPERMDWWSLAMARLLGCGGVLEGDLCLVVSLGSISQDAIAAQEHALATQLGDSIQMHPLANWPQVALGRPPAPGEWLLHLGCRPASMAQLMLETSPTGLCWQAGLTTGLGYAVGTLTVEQVLRLRNRLTTHGGFLTILVQPPATIPSPLPPWQRQPAADVMLAIKHALDPYGVVSGGGVPGG